MEACIENIMKLKLCCKDLIKNPNKNHAHKIAEVAITIPTEILQHLLEDWLLPIVICLKSNSVSTNVKEELVRTLRVIIQRIRITKYMYFIEIYTSLLIQIFDKSQPNKVIKFHEELKEAIALCIKDLVHQSCSDVIEQLYAKRNVEKLGEGILLLLIIARTEKSSAVRLAAIDAIMALCYIDDHVDKFDVVMQEVAADSIMVFLPGIVSGLQEIAMGTEIQNHNVTTKAIQAWGRIISLILHDKEEEDIIFTETLMEKSCNVLNNTSDVSTSGHKCDIKNNLRGATRNREWLEAAAIKLGDCIGLLGQIKSNSHYKVRRELVESIGLILKNCSKNMKPNIMTLVDYLLSLSEDESAEVGEKARNALHIVNENMQKHNMKPLVYLLEDKFYNLLTRLPTVVRRSDDNEQLAALNQFAGYLRLLGKQRLSNIMSSHIRRLLLALAQIMVIDCSNVSLLQTINVKDLDDPAHFYGSDSWKEFKFIKSNLCKEKLVAICKLLRELGNFQILVENILGLMSDAPQYRKELSLLFNWILASVEDSSTLDSCKQIVNFYIMPEVWNLPIEVNENTPLVQAQSNTVQCCLLTEGLGHIAQNLQDNNDFTQTFLRQTLYLIIERAGSGNGLISYIGVRTLETIAETQHHKTIGDLLRANVDYFSYHVIINLRNVDRNPGVLDVIEVVMKYSKLDFLPYLKGIVEDVLRQISTPYYQKNDYSFLKIFYTFIICIKTLMKKEDSAATKEEATPVPNTCSETIILSLLEHYNKKKGDKKIDDNFEGMESNTDVPNGEQSEETNDDYLNDEDKTLPIHIMIIVKIMKRCLNYLPLKNVQKSLMAMQTLQEGLLLLVEWENELLPIVHQLWHPLTNRFDDENVLVINRAWQLLHVLANVSNDFIRSRTLRQVLPSVFKFLNESSKESIDKSSIDIYKFTQTYKLQYELLSTFGLIARLLKLLEKDLWQILSSTYMYLNAHQHAVLQACCVKLYKDIADYKGDIVWTKCLSIWNSKVARISTDATFEIEEILGYNSDAASPNEYRKNVQEIIMYIQEKNAQC